MRGGGYGALRDIILRIGSPGAACPLGGRL